MQACRGACPQVRTLAPPCRASTAAARCHNAPASAAGAGAPVRGCSSLCGQAAPGQSCTTCSRPGTGERCRLQPWPACTCRCLATWVSAQPTLQRDACLQVPAPVQAPQRPPSLSSCACTQTPALLVAWQAPGASPPGRALQVRRQGQAGRRRPPGAEPGLPAPSRCLATHVRSGAQLCAEHVHRAAATLPWHLLQERVHVRGAEQHVGLWPVSLQIWRAQHAAGLCRCRANADPGTMPSWPRARRAARLRCLPAFLDASLGVQLMEHRRRSHQGLQDLQAFLWQQLLARMLRSSRPRLTQECMWLSTEWRSPRSWSQMTH